MQACTVSVVIVVVVVVVVSLSSKLTHAALSALIPFSKSSLTSAIFRSSRSFPCPTFFFFFHRRPSVLSHVIAGCRCLGYSVEGWTYHSHHEYAAEPHTRSQTDQFTVQPIWFKPNTRNENSSSAFAKHPIFTPRRVCRQLFSTDHTDSTNQILVNLLFRRRETERRYKSFESVLLGGGRVGSGALLRQPMNPRKRVFLSPTSRLVASTKRVSFVLSIVQ